MAEVSDTAAENLLMESHGLPTTFGKGKKRKMEYENTWEQTESNLKVTEKMDGVNQLVLTYAYSHRPQVASIREDLAQIIPNTSMVVHNFWPSARITNSSKKFVLIRPIVPVQLLGLTDDIPKHLAVPTSGPHSIRTEIEELMKTIWFPLTEGVRFMQFHNYNWYKHGRFNFLDSGTRNFWDTSVSISMPIVSSQVGENLMAFLTQTKNYTVGSEYKCGEFADDLDYFFGVTVDVRFGRTIKPIGKSGCYLYWKDVRILYDKLMLNRITFNSTQTLNYKHHEKFIFEDLYARDDLPSAYNDLPL